MAVFLRGSVSSMSTLIVWPTRAAFFWKTSFCWASMISSLRRAGDFGGNGGSVVQSARGGAGFRGELEDADVFEAKAADKFQQFLVLLFGFGGEAGDEGGAERDAGDPFAELAEEGFDLIARHLAAHGVEDLIVDMLQRHVDVFHDVAAIGERFDHVIGEATRVSIHQPQPRPGRFLGDKFIERAEHSAEAFPGRVKADVFAVAGRVLADEVEFNRAIRKQFFGFAQNVAERFGSHAAADAKGSCRMCSPGCTLRRCEGRRNGAA